MSLVTCHLSLVNCHFPPPEHRGIMSLSKRGRKTAETGHSSGAPELRDLLHILAFFARGILHSWHLAFCLPPPISTRRAARNAEKCRKMQNNAEKCGKMHMAATGQATISTHPASKRAARRAHGPRRVRNRRRWALGTCHRPHYLGKRLDKNEPNAILPGRIV